MTMTAMVPAVFTLAGMLGRYAPLWLLNEVGAQSFLKDACRPVLSGVYFVNLCVPGASLNRGGWTIDRPFSPGLAHLLNTVAILLPT